MRRGPPSEVVDVEGSQAWPRPDRLPPDTPPWGAPEGGSPWIVARSVASQTAVLVAVLFYFGWASARATWSYFGVDVSLLGFSTSDFLLRSVYSAYQPLLVIGLGALAVLCVHQALLRLAARGKAPPNLRSVPVIALAASSILAAVGALGLAVHSVAVALGAWLPAALALGAALGAYADRVWPLFRAAGVDEQLGQAPRGDKDDDDRRLRGFLLLGIAVLGLFWWTGQFAAHTGRVRAQHLADDLPSATEVAVYATRQLAIPHPACVKFDTFAPNQKYRYRYTGLRLLLHGAGHYFLVPSCWVRGAHPPGGVTYDLSEADDIRLDFTPGG